MIAFNPDIINYNTLGGIVPAVVQHAEDHRILMVGFMNRDALERTLKTGYVVFWSRSRQSLWMKGETSGNRLRLVDIIEDCDQDTLLVKALPEGPTCHTGAFSCFRSECSPTWSGILEELQRTIHQRHVDRPEGSYTAKLINSGIERVAQKVGEEAVEVAVAAQHPDKQRIIEESADLLYHLFVLLEASGIQMEEVGAVLADRRK